MSDARFELFLEEHIATVRPLHRDAALAWWDHSVTGEQAAADRAAKATARLLKVYANPASYAFTGSFDSEILPGERLRRQHNILRRAFASEQMPPEVVDQIVKLETEIDHTFNTYRAEVNGKRLTENDVREIMRHSKDAGERRQAWEASKRIGGDVADQVLAMVRLRNEAARKLGYANHYSKSMALSELDEERVFTLFGDLARLTEPLWDSWKGRFDAERARHFGISEMELRPWHFTDVFFQEPPPGELDLDPIFQNSNLKEMTAAFFASIGLPVEPILARSDLYERAGKNQHAFCTHIDNEGDVRVLCNIRPTEHWMGTMLHEFGHAVYDYYTDFDLPFLLRGPAHTLSTEAIAELMGRFCHDPVWLGLYAGVGKAEAERIGPLAQEADRIRFLIFTRWILVICNFEREMYRNPDQDLNTLWWDLVERYQRIRRPDGRNRPDWASKVHLALAPVYYQNYLLGEMVAAQLLRHLRDEVFQSRPAEALFTSQDTGQWLKERVFLQGATRPWEEGLRFATGSPLLPEYFVAQLT